MNIIDIIGKKRDGGELGKDEIEFFVKEYVAGRVTDYQAAALVMAIYIRGMNEREITDLTLAMAYSGDVLDLSELGEVIDKHSTGGVGDKITLILMPIIASLGIPVAKMSGRGLGFTGGTIDKLESIPGYRTAIPVDEFIANVKRVGISLIGQTINLAPADKKLYALRDSIGCTASIPLIASSIMSKKIAAGANKIVVDVTCGSGAFMKTREDAERLGRIMSKIGEMAGRETVFVITDMDQPVGYAVGNSLEVIEAIRVLRGEILPADIKEIICELGANMIILAKLTDDANVARDMILRQIENGQAFEKFEELVENQGGDLSFVEDVSKFEKAKFVVPIVAKRSGVVSRLDALNVGRLAGFLGAGRVKKEDAIDPRVGFVFTHKVGDSVCEGDILGRIFADSEDKLKYVQEQNIFEIE